MSESSIAGRMFRVLVIDDDHAKATLVTSVIAEISPNVLIDRASSVADAVGVARVGGSYDLMVLDLMLPHTDGGAPDQNGGTEAIRLLSGRGLTPPAEHIVALTAFGELAVGQSRELAGHGITVLGYGPDSGWESALAKLITRTCDQRELRAGEHDFDALFVTALHDVELEAVLDLPMGWTAGDAHGSFFGTVTVDAREKRCVAMACPEMGMPTAAAVVAHAMHEYRPRLVVMTGIAAGVDEKLGFGDVVIADVVWDYGAGKWQRDGRGSRFAPAPSQRRIAESVLRRARCVKRTTWTTAVRVGWKGPGSAPSGSPSIAIGPFASGAAVVQDEDIVSRIRGTNRKVLGLDMEAYGVVVAAQCARAATPEVLICKSICDFADKDKDDRYQRYAAYTSAQMAFAILSEQGA